MNLSTASNVATIAACVLVASAAAPTIKRAWFGSGAAPAVERVKADVRTSVPELNLTRNPIAKTAVIEFSDFECPFCGAYARETFPQIQQEYVDTGKILYGYRHFPLTTAHPFALDAAKAAQCAGEQQQFWGMHELLFHHQTALAMNYLDDYAGRLDGLKRPQFEACMKASGPSLARDIAEGKRLGIAGTPTFLIGRVEPSGDVRVLMKIRGAKDFEVFADAIREALGNVPNHS